MRYILTFTAAVAILPATVCAAGRFAPSLPSSIEYSGFTGSQQYPVFNDFKITQDGGTLGGSAYMQIGIFSGEAPITGSYANGECTAIRKKQTYRGPCDANAFSGVIYDSKGKPGEAFRFISNAELAREKAGGGVRQEAANASEPVATPSVWSLGRARFLVEPHGGCSPEIALGTKRYCFNQAIDWLRRHPDRQAVDVVAMQNAWQPGSFVPHNNGIGWDIYKVARRGNQFTADKQVHYATKVQVPQGCLYAGVAGQAWYIAVTGWGKVAIEAASYRCENGWNGGNLYTAYLDTNEIDGSPGGIEFAGAVVGNGSTSQRQSTPGNGYEGQLSGFDGPPPVRQGYDPLAGTSAEFYVEPGATAPKSKRRKH